LPSKDQSIGAIIFVGCIIGIIAYAYLVFNASTAILILQLTGLVAVGGVLAIGAWIGWTMATTPPPKPIEEIEKELEESSEEESEEKTEEKAEEKAETESKQS